MILRAIAVALVLALAPPFARAQSRELVLVDAIDGERDATRLQRTIAERWARLAALRTRYGEQHAEVAREREVLRALLEHARTERLLPARIERARVVDWLRRQIAEVDARLGELSVSCSSGHPDVRTGQARREAFVTALAAIERRGVFLPDL